MIMSFEPPQGPTPPTPEFVKEMLLKGPHEGGWSFEQAWEALDRRVSMDVVKRMKYWQPKTPNLPAVSSGPSPVARLTTWAAKNARVLRLAGVVTTGLILAMIVLGAAYYYYNHDLRPPVEYGPAALDRPSEPALKPAVTVEPARPSEPYAIWLVVVGDHKEVMVGRKSVIEEQPSTSVIGWGISSKKVKDHDPTWQKVSIDFYTTADAQAAYDAAIVPGSLRTLTLVSGTVVRLTFADGEYKCDNVTRFLH
jgi:hypothetical protein